MIKGTQGVRFIRVLFCILLGVTVFLPACERPRETATLSKKIKVVASIYPLADFVRNVGGDRVEVLTLLPPAASPHVYSPAPRDLARISGAKLFVKVGLGFEFWAGDLARSGAGTGLLEVDTSEGVDALGEAEGGHDHAERVANPHIWLDPLLARQQVKRIEEALIRVDPTHGPEYEKNAESYRRELALLDREIRETVKTFKQTSFVAFHPSWAYFARRYGLAEAGVIETAPGREPSPAELMRIVRIMRETGVRVIFAEPQLNPKAAYVIASEVGATVLVLDPIGSPDQTDRSTYLKLMRYNLSVMQQGMGSG